MVAPTPPAGIPAARIDAPRSGAGALSNEPVASAPGLSAPRAVLPPTLTDASAREIICARCQTRNPSAGRFCVSCGSSLDGDAYGAPPPATMVEGDEAQAPPVIAQVRLSPAAVVQVASEQPAPAPVMVTCDRCQGVCDAGMRFCKFCGSPLAHRAEVADEGSMAVARKPAVPGPGLEPKPVVADETAARQIAPAPEQRSATPQQVAGPAAPPSLSSPERSMTRPASSQSPPQARADAVHGKPTGAAVSTQTGQFLPFAGASSLPSGRLVVVGGDGQEGPSFPMTGDQVDIGRIEGNVVLPDDKYMSPRHARIVRVKGQWFVRDLESTNGVFVRLEGPHDLTDGDLLLLGVEVLKFEVVKDAEMGLGPAVQHGTLVFGSPALPRPARLVQRTVEGVARDVYHLHRPETVIGRESGDIVFTDDPYMSRKHAMLRRSTTNGAFSLTDLNSSNGTFVAIRGDWLLQDGDSIRVGQHLFRVELAPG